MTDLYVVPCVCGKDIRTSEKTGVCPFCGRMFEFEWGKTIDQEGTNG
jgi:hypothetical protein